MRKMRAHGLLNIFQCLSREGKDDAAINLSPRLLTPYSMYHAYSAPHEKMAWEARMEPAVIEIFEKLWETNELISSFDGMNISLPKRKDISWSPWPHCDQNQNRKG